MRWGAGGGSAERAVARLLAATERAVYAQELAAADGLLQRLDPRAKLIGLFALIVAVVAARDLAIIAALFALAVTLAAASAVPLSGLASRLWAVVLLFTGVIALPAPFLVPGDVVYRLPGLGWAMSAQGLHNAAFLIARAETAATFAVLLVLCTPWAHVLKAMRALHIPVVAVVILGMTYRYIFLLLNTAAAMFESRRARLVGRLPARARRELVYAGAGVLLSKSIGLSQEVYLAMVARGYSGEVVLLEEFRMARRDWIALAASLLLAVSAIVAG